MPILEKILEIQKNIKVKKTGEHPKYGAFMRDEDVVNAVRAELNHHSIIVTSEVVSAEHSAVFDQYDKYRPRAFARINFTFNDVTDGTSIVQSVMGEGSSHGDDVSSRKIFTQARKIAFLQLFQIGEVNDSYDSDSERSAQPEPEAKPDPGSVKLNSKELGRKLTDLINSPLDAHVHITGASAIAVGRKVAEELYGADPKRKDTDWKKDGAVLELLIALLKDGENTDWNEEGAITEALTALLENGEVG